MVFKRSWAIEVAGQRPIRSASRRVGSAGAMAGLLLRLRSGNSGLIKSALSMNHVAQASRLRVHRASRPVFGEFFSGGETPPEPAGRTPALSPAPGAHVVKE